MVGEWCVGGGGRWCVGGGVGDGRVVCRWWVSGV